MKGGREGFREDAGEGGLRIDKWLWFTRFFKTRSEATHAVTGGLVHVDDERVKPARLVRFGERLTITKGDLRFVVIVQGMPVRRGTCHRSAHSLH